MLYLSDGTVCNEVARLEVGLLVHEVLQDVPPKSKGL